MSKYTELKAKHSKMINDFPMAFAFNEKQFVEAMKKLGAESTDDLRSLPGGGMIHVSSLSDYKEMIKTMDQETEEANKDDEYLRDGFLYELRNHEYCYLQDPDATLRCFGLSWEEVQKDERMLNIFNDAKREYWATVEP